jgi:hypothetical protein
MVMEPIQFIGDDCPIFFKPKPASGLSTHSFHQFLKTHQIQHPFEVISQGGEAPFAPTFVSPFNKKCV